MRRAEIAELPRSLAEVLEAVRSGEEVLLYDKGRPIARITPVPSGGPSEEDIEALVRQGGIRPPQVPMDAAFLERFLEGPWPEDPEGAVLAALLAEREEGR
jgi:prevent-host-death family protein